MDTVVSGVVNGRTNHYPSKILSIRISVIMIRLCYMVMLFITHHTLTYKIKSVKFQIEIASFNESVNMQNENDASKIKQITKYNRTIAHLNCVNLINME